MFVVWNTVWAPEHFLQKIASIWQRYQDLREREKKNLGKRGGKVGRREIRFSPLCSRFHANFLFPDEEGGKASSLTPQWSQTRFSISRTTVSPDFRADLSGGKSCKSSPSQGAFPTPKILYLPRSPSFFSFHFACSKQRFNQFGIRGPFPPLSRALKFAPPFSFYFHVPWKREKGKKGQARKRFRFRSAIFFRSKYFIVRKRRKSFFFFFAPWRVNTHILRIYFPPCFQGADRSCAVRRGRFLKIRGTQSIDWRNNLVQEIIHTAGFVNTCN